MRRLVLFLYTIFINVAVFAQTQYDYYDDDVAYQKPVIDGFSILGLIMLIVIGFIIWLICAIVKDWLNKHMDNTPKTKSPKPKSSLEIMNEQIEKARRQRELAWEAKEEEKLKAEAIEILKNEYCEPHIMDGVRYVLKYDTLREDTIDAFVRGYIWGSFRQYSFLSIEEFKKRFHPIVVLGYLRGLQEQKEVWEKFGKFPG